jgi:hypothetical protein
LKLPPFQFQFVFVRLSQRRFMVCAWVAGAARLVRFGLCVYSVGYLDIPTANIQHQPTGSHALASPFPREAGGAHSGAQHPTCRRRDRARAASALAQLAATAGID